MKYITISYASSLSLGTQGSDKSKANNMKSKTQTAQSEKQHPIPTLSR